MPVRTVYRPLPSSAERQRDLRLGRLPIDYRAAHRTSSITAMHAPRVLDDAGRDADAAGAARLGRAVAQVDALAQRALHERVGPVAGAHEHEVRRRSSSSARPSRSHAA